MARNSTEQLGGDYDLESREFAFSCTSSSSQHTSPRHLQNVVLCLFLKGWGFCVIMYCCNSDMAESNDIRKFTSLNLAHRCCCYLQRVLVQRGLLPRTRA